MIPLQTLATEKLPGRGGSLELSRRGDSWFLSFDRVLFRSTETRRIEEVAVIGVCEPLAVKRQPRLLLEGLGLGQAARKALQVLPPRGHVTVAEPIGALADWQGKFLPPISPKKPDHFQIVPQSLQDCLEERPGSFDAVILEVDYLLEAFLESASRPKAYRASLQGLKRALRPRGRLAIHTPDRDGALMRALQGEGFLVEHRMESPHKRSKARRHHMLLATLPAGESD